jgi:hypothetical protein
VSVGGLLTKERGLLWRNPLRDDVTPSQDSLEEAPMAKYHDHKPDFLSLQANIICVLLFLIGVAMIVQHPAWFR